MVDRENQNGVMARVITETQLGESGKLLSDVLTQNEIEDLIQEVCASIRPTPVEQVTEFHETFNQFVSFKPGFPLKERLRLRLNLIFEELIEFSEAAGVKLELLLLAQEWVTQTGRTDVGNPNPNIVEALDALCDLEYVLSGTIVECGFTDFFYEAFTAVHDSNMSKLAPTEDIAKRTCEQVLSLKGEKCSYKFIPEKGFLITRDSDDKVIKALTYDSVNLLPFFEADELG